MATVPVLKGLVLAGGASSRMGTDKAALVFSGDALLDRAVAQLRAVVTDVFVSAREEQRSVGSRARYDVLPDVHSDIGPAAGLLAAHNHDRRAAWLVLAVDMLRVDAALLGELVAARSTAHAATAWRRATTDEPEPLCTIYEPATLAAFAASINAGGSPSPRSWLVQQDVKLLNPPASEVLASANTREEYERLIAGAGADKRDI